jgi:hypothetical protein
MYTGSWMETQYELLTYGIPVSVMPLHSETGAFLPELHKQWLKNCREAEERYDEAAADSDSAPAANKSPSTVTSESSTVTSGKHSVFTIPGTYDVLFGKNQQCHAHSGNIRYLNMIGERWDEYDAASKEERHDIIQDVIDSVHTKGGRFLKLHKERNQWELVLDMNVCKDKGRGFLRFHCNKKCLRVDSSDFCFLYSACVA